MTRQPFTAKLGRRTFTIKWQDNLTDDDGNQCFGLSDYNAKTILLDTSLDEEDFQEIFIHESIHMVATALGEDARWREERVQRWGHALAQMLAPILKEPTP